MDCELTACCEKSIEPKIINRLEIRKVSNGYLVEGYGFPTMVFLTIDEALAIVRKALG